MRKFTDLLMDKIADSLAAKPTFLIFIIVAVLPLFCQRPHDLLGWQQWVSQTFVQLVALNVLAVVAKKEGREQQKLLKETHDAVMQELKLVRTTVKMLHAEQKEIRQLVQLGGGKFDC